MKRLVILLLALAGLTTLFASCGGGGDEKTSILALAFRLDGGSPVMSAYIGDPAQDPFQLSVGRYYIETLDQNDVLLSLGAVDIEEGDVVDFPPSFDPADAVAGPQAAEPLITLAGFLIDVELAKYEFLNVVTGGFSEAPFDPAVDLDPANFEGLFEMYAEIATQEDAVLAALSKIERRAEVSLGIAYVCSSWPSAPDAFDYPEAEVIFLMGLLRQAQAAGQSNIGYLPHFTKHKMPARGCQSESGVPPCHKPLSTRKLITIQPSRPPERPRPAHALTDFGDFDDLIHCAEPGAAALRGAVCRSLAPPEMTQAASGPLPRAAGSHTTTGGLGCQNGW